MRSFDRAMPEELNRVLTDHASDLLLCPSQTAVDNLRREGVAGEVVLVGDVMVDIAHLFQPRARDETPAFHPPYVLATAHRAGNVDDPERLAALVDLLLAIEEDVILPLHPRTHARLESAGLLDRLAAGVELLAPQGYLDFTSLLVHARAVLTDSGGVQKEAYLARVPCVTLRDTTEWTETVDAGWNVLVDLDRAAALAALQRTPPDGRPELYGDGRAGERVVSSLSA
jgi:UDP-N-acetylglucosamine 2-epimerase (non-hydrolysing)/UDP-GlcNAc3NAcA epimerase